ncbi:MAG: hypothetical protein RI995_624, partial [Bacteroidota bacterium]
VDDALKLIHQSEQLEKIGQAAKKLGKPNAAKEIAQKIIQSTI